MASPSGVAGSTRWQAATDALLNIVPLLPPDDALTLGSFARELRWWTTSRSVRESIAHLTELPPGDVQPQGPTNLKAALEQIAGERRGAMPTEVLILSDADAAID